MIADVVENTYALAQSPRQVARLQLFPDIDFSAFTTEEDLMASFRIMFVPFSRALSTAANALLFFVVQP